MRNIICISKNNQHRFSKLLLRPILALPERRLKALSYLQCRRRQHNTLSWAKCCYWAWSRACHPLDWLATLQGTEVGRYTNCTTQFQQVEINIHIGNSSAEFKQEKLNLCLLHSCWWIFQSSGIWHCVDWTIRTVPEFLGSFLFPYWERWKLVDTLYGYYFASTEISGARTPLRLNFCKMAPNILGSYMWKFLLVTFLETRFIKVVPGLLKTCGLLPHIQ